MRMQEEQGALINASSCHWYIRWGSRAGSLPWVSVGVFSGQVVAAETGRPHRVMRTQGALCAEHTPAMSTQATTCVSPTAFLVAVHSLFSPSYLLHVNRFNVRMPEIGCLSRDNTSSSHQVTGILDAGVAFSMVRLPRHTGGARRGVRCRTAWSVCSLAQPMGGC